MILFLILILAFTNAIIFYTIDERIKVLEKDHRIKFIRKPILKVIKEIINKVIRKKK
jgi:hypothetical protein